MDIASAAFRALIDIDGVQVTHKASTLSVLIELPSTYERSFDASPGPDWEYRIHALRSDFALNPKVGEALTSAAYRYKINSIRQSESDPIIELSCAASPL